MAGEAQRVRGCRLVGRGCGQAAGRTFLFFLLDVTFAELFPPRSQVLFRRGIDGRGWCGLGVPVAHAGARKGAVVTVHAAGHGGRRRRAGGLSSGGWDPYVQAQGVAGASRDQMQLLGANVVGSERADAPPGGKRWSSSGAGAAYGRR